MHAISSYRGNRPTNTHTNAATNPQTHIQDRLQYTCAAKLSAQCKNGTKERTSGTDHDYETVHYFGDDMHKIQSVFVFLAQVKA